METDQLHAEVRQLRGVVIQLAESVETIRSHFANAPGMEEVYGAPDRFLSLLSVVGQRCRNIGRSIPRMETNIEALKEAERG